jgi:hypothetical protein
MAGTGNPNWSKGKSANPSGRPKGIGLGPLLEAIKRVEKKKKQKFFDRAVEMAWTEPTVMNGILKKLVPDQLEVNDKARLLLDE